VAKQAEGRVIPKRTRDGTIVHVVRFGREYLGTFTTETEAGNVLEVRRELAAGQHIRTIATLGPAYLVRRAELEAKRRGKAHYTGKQITNVWNRYVKTAPFARRSLDRLPTRAEVQSYIQSIVGRPAVRWNKHTKRHELTGKRVGQATAKHAQWLLSGFYSWAKAEANPAEGVRLERTQGVIVKLDKDSKPHLHIDEIDRLFALPRKQFRPKLRAAYAVAIYAGLRPGEVWGLRWENVLGLDGKRPELEIRWSYDGPTKTQAGQRELPLLPQAVRELRAYRDSLGARPIAGLVFVSQIGKGMHKRGYDGDWRRFRKLIGARKHIAWKHMRHSLATHLLSGAFTKGHAWPMARIAQLLGHESEKITAEHYASPDVEVLHRELDRGR